MNVPYATTLPESLIKAIKIYAVMNNLRANEVIEKALNSFLLQNKVMIPSESELKK
jgi:hypothetical protein